MKKKVVSILTMLTIFMSLMPHIVFADGETLTATVSFVVNGQTLGTQAVTVPVMPQKDYISDATGGDVLEGKASAYDALLTAIGRENVDASTSGWINAITIDGTKYVNTNGEYICDFSIYYSAGYWMIQSNGEYIDTVALAHKLENGDTVTFVYEPTISDMHPPYESICTPYGIGGIMNQDGGSVISGGLDGVTDVYVTATKFDANAPAADVILAAYDKSGALLETRITPIGDVAVLEEKEADLLTLPAGTQTVKAFVWNQTQAPFGNMRSYEAGSDTE